MSEVAGDEQGPVINRFVAGLPPLTTHGLYSCPRWLRTLELGGRAPTTYITGGTTAGALGLLAVHLTPSTTNPRYAPSHLLRGLEPNTADRYCLAGSLSGYQCDLPVAIHAGDDAPNLIVSEAVSWAAGHGSALLLPYLTAPALATLSPETRRTAVLEDFECWVDCPFSTANQFVEALPRKARQDAARDQRKFVKAGLAASWEPLASCIYDFARLVCVDSLKFQQEVPLDSLVRHFCAINEVFSGDAVVLTARDTDNELLGGALAIFHGQDLYLRMTGFDRRTKGTSAYFNLLYFAPFLLKDRRKFMRVHHGSSLLDMKIRHGARVSPLWTAVFGSHRGLVEPRTQARRLEELASGATPRTRELLCSVLSDSFSARNLK